MNFSNDKLNLNFSRPCVMAIVNVTPDSFFEQSRTAHRSDIERRVREVVAQGADIIDIGGYSSRPGAEDVSPQQEWQRVELGLSVVRDIAPDIVVSLDTFRGDVARRAVEKFGALIINDISAGEIDPSIVDVVAEYQLPYIAMHMRGVPQSMQGLTEYRDVVQDVVDYFVRRVEELKVAGVIDIILDPGFGFAKSLEQNYSLMRGLHKLCELGYPVLSGVSRKSMIYKLLDTSPQEALAGTIALGWESLRQGAKILRVHDVREAVESVTIFGAYDKSE
ncbi:MAG: dihydropteroate synthase [Rikenellaceae bacterium]